jgi:hypothetical protein
LFVSFAAGVSGCMVEPAQAGVVLIGIRIAAGKAVE